jgi:hypothetical protein
MKKFIHSLFTALILSACASNHENNSSSPAAQPLVTEESEHKVTVSFYEPRIRDLFENFNNMAWVYGPVRDYYGLTDDQIRLLRQETFERGLKTLKQLDDHATSIPLITHRIWLTASDKPFDVPEDALERYIESVRFLKDKGTYTHYFWCLDKSKIKKTIATLKNSDVGKLIIVREFKEIKSQLKCLKYINYALHNRLFPTASDFLRNNLIVVFGGIYTVRGWLVNRDITALL